MKTGFFALLFVGILFALSDAFTFPWQTRSRDVMQIDSRAITTFEGVEGVDLQHLEARKARGGSRTARKRPAKKRPAKKRPTKKKATKKPTKKPTKKKTTKKKTTKTGKKCTAAMKKAGKCGTTTKKCTAAMKKAGKCKGTATKKCTAAMKKAGKCTGTTKCTAAMQKAGKCTPTKTSSAIPSGTSAAACKWSPKAKAGSKDNSKLQARIDSDPCRPPSENDRIMIENYKIAEKAARKKGKKLAVNQMYLFLMKQGPTVGAKHHSVMVGKVMKVGNQLGMEATIQQLTKPSENGMAVRHENAKFFCGSAFGGVCQTGPYRRVECGKLNAKYKLVGGAGVEFADPEHFIQKGEEVFMAEKPYNVLTWNCQVFAKNLINVTKLKSGQIVKLTNEQALPSQPIDSDSDSDDENYYSNPEGGFRVVNADPLPYDRDNNNGARFEID